MTFGMPVFGISMMPYGVEVKLSEIVLLYSGGEIAVVCSAKRAFKVVAFERTIGVKIICQR